MATSRSPSAASRHSSRATGRLVRELAPGKGGNILTAPDAKTWLFLGEHPTHPIGNDAPGNRPQRIDPDPRRHRSTALFTLASVLPAAMLARMSASTSWLPCNGSKPAPATGRLHRRHQPPFATGQLRAPEPIERQNPMPHNNLDALAVTPKTGDEPFSQQGRAIGANLRDFWSWACSDLVNNAMRGVLAEYIVGLALGCVGSGTRLEWDATDLRTRQGLRVEVKSSAYLQSWKQERLSKISFDIKPALGWDATTNTNATERARQADVYVFCVLASTDKAAVDPLNLDQWDFYVMSTKRLNAAVGEQKTITLGSLLKNTPAKCSFAELPACIEVEANQERTHCPPGS